MARIKATVSLLSFFLIFDYLFVLGKLLEPTTISLSSRKVPAVSRETRRNLVKRSAALPTVSQKRSQEKTPSQATLPLDNWFLGTDLQWVLSTVN
jgi:hypothetical protein